MMKYMKGKHALESHSDNAHSFAHFAGMIIRSLFGECYVVNLNCHGSWIVDTGASDYMTHNLKYFTKIQPLQTPIHIKLPNGSFKSVTYAGQVQLDSKIVLYNVLYVPDFKFSLISVNKLLIDLQLDALFTLDTCTFQDPSTKLPVAVAHVDHGLYQFRSVGQAGHNSNTKPAENGQNKENTSLIVTT